MTISVDLTKKELISSLLELNDQDKKEFVLSFDLSVARVDFTLDLIASLVHSLASDLTPKEIEEEIKKICYGKA